MHQLKLYLDENHNLHICEYDILRTFGSTQEEALEKMNGLMKILCKYDSKEFNNFFFHYLKIQQKDLEPEFDKHFWDTI